ncbi:MAG: hypothetical protein NPIRA04_00810 [Nitrospirales bacterium]|nr:MAG: hypothetical protein NPIRA04_00810 [Nitrospirales bacterium]
MKQGVVRGGRGETVRGIVFERRVRSWLGLGFVNDLGAGHKGGSVKHEARLEDKE